MKNKIFSFSIAFGSLFLILSCGGSGKKKTPPPPGSLGSAFQALAKDSVLQDSLNRIKIQEETILNNITLKNGIVVNLRDHYEKLDSLFRELTFLGNISEIERLQKIYINTLIHKEVDTLSKTNFFFDLKYDLIISRMKNLKVARAKDLKLAVVAWDRYTKVIPNYSKASLYKVSPDSTNIKWISSFKLEDFKLKGEENFLVDSIYSYQLQDTSLVYMFYGQVKCGIWCVGQRLEAFKISEKESNIKPIDFFPDKRNKSQIPTLKIEYDFRHVKKDPNQDKLSASFKIDSSNIRITYPELESFTEKKQVIKTLIFDGDYFVLDKVKEYRLYKQ
jgi:hypothetical protein